MAIKGKIHKGIKVITENDQDVWVRRINAIIKLLLSVPPIIVVIRQSLC